MAKLLFIVFFTVGIFCSFTSYSQSNITTSEGKRLGTIYPFNSPITQGTSVHKKKLLKAQRTVPNFDLNMPLQEVNTNAFPNGMDPVLQSPSFNPPQPPILPKFNIEGLSESDAAGVAPPDVTGDVSANYYLQAVNGTFIQVFNRLTGEAVSAPISTNSFWQDLGFTGNGDPIIVFDQAANRWVFIEFSGFQNALALAVSSTEDPTGAWTAYEFQTVEFPDYPKMSLWKDSYFITSNEGGTAEIPLYFLEREAILNEESSFGVQSLLEISKFQSADAFQVAAPIGWDGSTIPDATTGPMAIRMYDDSWGTQGVDRLEIWEFSIDWDNPNNSGVVQTIELPTSPFESTLCGSSPFQCIPQPSGELLSVLQHVVMHRPTYRKFINHESIVCTHTVDVNGSDHAGVRWYELRRTSAQDWHIYQEGTIAPDNDHRFMPTIAIDATGNIALAYAVTGSNTELSLRYTARNNGDPLGEMTYEEFEVGKGLSNSESNRWGDYFTMSVDPISQNEFWLTGEYMLADNTWGTKIAAFIIHKDSIDIGPSGLTSPMSDTLLSSSETISASFRNFGYLDQSDFWVGYELEDGTTVIDTINYALAADSTYAHTFEETVDFSIIGDYSVKLFSGLVNDANIHNDTLRQIVYHLPRYDVTAGNSSHIIETLCSESTDLNVEVVNNGLSLLTSATIDISLNGSPFSSVPWSGNLGYLESEMVAIPINGFTDGSNTITINIHSPNGISDEIEDNNIRSLTLTYLENSAICTFTLITDNYPAEVSWDLQTLSGDIIYSGGGYTGNVPITHQEDWCLNPDSCYIFNIYDSWGDGLAEDPDATYTIVDQDGNTLASLMELNYGTQETNEFCATFECSIEGTGASSPESATDANDGNIILTTTAGVPPFMYSIDNGETFQTSNLFENLGAGVYQIIIQDATDCFINFDIEVTTLVGTNDQNDYFNISIAPNPTDGLIDISVNGIHDVSMLELLIFDNTGSRIHRGRLAKYNDYLRGKVSLRHLPDGVYFIQFQHPSLKKNMTKIIKQ